VSRKTALVTGACGMIGSHIVDYLVDEKKMFVVALDPAPPFWISRHILNDDAVYIHGSSFDAAQVNKIRREFDVDVIFDIGALLGSEECMPRLDTAITMTTLGARNIAELALDSGAKVFYILTEFSTELYRDFTDGYTITKNAAADVYREYKKQNPDLDLCFARVHHVFSPRQKLLPVRKLLPTAIAYAVTGSKFKIFGEATANKRVDYIHGEDAAKVIVECTLNEVWLETPLFDIGGCDENFLSVKEVVESVIDVVGDGSYEIIEDFRKQPATSTKATNNWKEYIQTFEMKKFKNELPNVVDAFLDRYSLEDFKLAVKVFEDRLRWGV